MRRFLLRRGEDVTGVSGTGDVAEGVTFFDETTVIRWRGVAPSTVVWPSPTAAMAVHGHDGRTRMMWLDETAGSSVAPGDPPRVTFDVASAAGSLDLATADVGFTPATQALLVRLGWTPPGDAR